MEPPEEPPSTSEHPVIKEEPDDEGPPNLLIDEDDDDGYPNTPPVLERQDYYIENEEEDPAPACSNAPPVPNRFFNYESEFYLPHNLRRLNPSKYVPHSHHFLLDLICILCQRVCNETHAVSCFANHRFCKDCIRPRLEKYGFCPRCGDKALGDAKPDPTYDKIIERMRYNKDEVNYVCLDPEREDQELSDFERDTSEEDSDSPDDGSYFRPTPPPVKPLSEQRHEFGEFMEKEIKRVRAAREADAKIEDEEVLKRKRLLQKRVSLSACPPYKYMQEHQLFDIVGDMPPQNSRNLLLETNRDGLKAGVHDVEDWMLPVKQSPRFATYLPPRWNPLNLQKPLQNMVYKTFWFNKDIEWPKNEPVPHPLGLTPTRLRDHKLMGKARRRIGNDPFLSKREKKISLHKFFTTQLEENLELSEFSSSSDDDEPPPKFCQFPFDYPSNYRKPRKDWRLLYDEEGNVRSGVKAKTRNTERVVFDRMARRWKKEWGEPLQLLRESSTQCAIPFKDLKRCYLGAPKHATIGHIQDYVYRKIALLRSLKLQYVKKRFRVNLHPVLWHGSGKNVEVIQCTDTQLPGQVKSPVKPALQQPPSAPSVLPKEISIYQNRTPTVRDLAIKTMNMGIKINPIVMDEAQVVQLQHAINITESPEKPKGKNAYQYKPRNPRQSCSKQELGAPRSASSTVLTLINSTPMNGISGRPTLAVAPYQPSTPTTLTNTSQHVPLVSPLVSLTNGQTPIIHSAPAMLIPTSMKTPTSVESTKQSAPALPTPGSVDGPPLLTPIGRPSVKLNEPNPEVDKFFTPPPNQPVVNTNPLLNLEGKEGLLHRMMGHEPAKRPALQPRVLANGLTQANAIALARALPPGATLTGVPGLRPSLLYPAPIGGAARTGFQTIKLSGPSTSVNDAPINLVPVVTQGDHIQYMQLTPDGKCIPLHASTLGGNILAITPPKGGINGAPQAPTFLKPMTSRDGRPYLQQVEPIIMQQQPQPPPPPPPPPPSAPTLQGAATGRRLSRKVTAFFINTPHVRLDLNVKIGDLRKQAKLKKGGRLVLVFSIHDLKCDQETDLTVPRGIPSLRKRRLRRYRSSIEKRPRYSGSSSDEGVDKKEEEEEDEDEEDEEEEKKEVKEEENEEKQEESDDEEDEGEEADD